MKLKKILEKQAPFLSAFVGVIAVFTVNSCRNMWYQPEEPEKLEEFAKRARCGK